MVTTTEMEILKFNQMVNTFMCHQANKIISVKIARRAQIYVPHLGVLSMKIPTVTMDLLLVIKVVDILENIMKTIMAYRDLVEQANPIRMD